MTVEERLREKSRIIQKFEQNCIDPNYTPIRFIDLDDAIEVTKDLFTKEQLEELLKKQRKICADAYRIIEKNDFLGDIATHNRIANAPSPLEGEKK